MKRYANRSGNSGVYAYDVQPDGLVVVFTSGAKYKYFRSALGEGRYQMAVSRAVNGNGLNSYLIKSCSGTYRKIG